MHSEKDEVTNTQAPQELWTLADEHARDIVGVIEESIRLTMQSKN